MAMEIPGLILSRRVDEVVLLLDRTTRAEIARVTVAALHPARVKLHFAAGYDIDIQRAENLQKPGRETSPTHDGSDVRQ